MNNIIVDNNKLCEDNLYIYQDIKSVDVLGNSTLNINTNIKELNIIVRKNATLTVNYFSIIDKLDSKITIACEDNANVTFNHSFITKDTYNLNLLTDFLGNNAYLCENIHGINDKGTSNITADGYVKNSKNNNELLENIRLININGGKGVSIPNMLISTSKVIANHMVTISSVPSDEIFYLMAKGIDLESARNLICNGHLTKIITDDKLLIKIKEILKMEVR